MGLTIKELRSIRRAWLDYHVPYRLQYFHDFDYTILHNIIYRKKGGRGSNEAYNDIIIMFDTETSKEKPNTTYEIINKKTGQNETKYNVVENYVVAWSICLFAFDRPLVTLWGHTPEELVDCIIEICRNMNGYETYLYAHNLSYDWTFLRKFFIKKYGEPIKQLNTKPHYPISITFESGHRIILKDSLILAQRKLEKWANDLDVTHKKAVGKWDYNKIRTQHEKFTDDELKYIECDVLAGCECIFKTMTMLKKSVASMPYTATGIPREEVRKLAKANHFREKFLNMAPTFEQYIKLTKVYHGGYTHANRHFVTLEVGQILDSKIVAYDFSSSYPYCMLAFKFPMEKFSKIEDCKPNFILENMENYAFMFKLIMTRPRLKDDFEPMPALQYSKCVADLNSIIDNGRVLCSEYIEIYCTEQDLDIIMKQYDFDGVMCTEVETAWKDYLPRWFTDYVFELYADKTKLKGGDPVLYNIQKAKLNSLYGLTVQKSLKDSYLEDYATGEFYLDSAIDNEEEYLKYLNKYTSVLPYFWGVWVTAYAFHNLFELGSCAEFWLYSDTDSCYGANWDTYKIDSYNNKCKKRLKANGYNYVWFNNREYWLGIAELDGEYKEFKTMGAKRYCARNLEGELKITVAGVPKKTGAKCLYNDISNFKKGFCFDGLTTGKLTHAYIFTDEIKLKNGIIYGDSIDLVPCNYILDDTEVIDWETIFYQDVEVQVYD